MIYHLGWIAAGSLQGCHPACLVTSRECTTCHSPRARKTLQAQVWPRVAPLYSFTRLEREVPSQHEAHQTHNRLQECSEHDQIVHRGDKLCLRALEHEPRHRGVYVRMLLATYNSTAAHTFLAPHTWMIAWFCAQHRVHTHICMYVCTHVLLVNLCNSHWQLPIHSITQLPVKREKLCTSLFKPVCLGAV